MADDGWRHLAANVRYDVIKVGPGQLERAIDTFCELVMPLGKVVDQIEQVTCPHCIEAWETATWPITTRDLAEVVKLIEELACRRNPDVQDKAEQLRERLLRPRKKP